MGATAYYVDPSIAANSGGGTTTGDPFGDLQYALDTITRDNTYGDIIHIKAGTDEVLTKELDFTTYGTPTESGMLTLAGYTSTAGDGGVGGIDCNAFGFISSAYQRVNLDHLEIHGIGTVAHGIRIDGWMSNCYVHDSSVTSTTCLAGAAGTYVVNCRFEDCGGTNVINGSAQLSCVAGCTFLQGTKNWTNSAITNATVASHNIIECGASGNGITLGNNAGAWNNSIISTDSGAGRGISTSTSEQQSKAIVNNLCEGFTGGTGYGIYCLSNVREMAAVHGNACYNNTNDYITQSDLIFDYDNESLSGTPFSKSGSLTYANRLTYFEPADEGNVLTPAGPTLLTNLAKGAVQPSAGGGGVCAGGFMVFMD